MKKKAAMGILTLVLIISFRSSAEKAASPEIAGDLIPGTNIFIARVEEAFDLPMDYLGRMEYTLSILRVISCTNPFPDSIVAIHTTYLQGFPFSKPEEGILEYSLISGISPGAIQRGDTVIVAGFSLPSGSTSVPMAIIPLGSPQGISILKAESETSCGN